MHRRFQFRLWTLFAIMAAIALGISVVPMAWKAVVRSFEPRTVLTTYQEGDIYYTLWNSESYGDTGQYDAMKTLPGQRSVPARRKQGRIQATFKDGWYVYTLQNDGTWIRRSTLSKRRSGVRVTVHAPAKPGRLN